MRQGIGREWSGKEVRNEMRGCVGLGVWSEGAGEALRGGARDGGRDRSPGPGSRP